MGIPVLHHLAEYDALEIVRLLPSAGANVSIKYKMGQKALDIAVKNGLVSTVDLLRQAEAHLEKRIDN